MALVSRTWWLYPSSVGMMKSGTIDFGGSHTFKARLLSGSYTPGTLSDTQLSDTTAYLLGTDQTVTLSNSSGTVSTGAASWSGGVSPRYVVIYDDTHANDALLCIADIGAVQVVPSGTTFSIVAQTLFTFDELGAAPLFTDDFETGDFAADANGFSYNLPAQDNGSITVVAANPNAGTYASRYRFNAVASGTDNHVEQSFDYPDSDEVWVEYYLRVPVGYAHRDEGQHKIFALWGADYATAGRPGVVFEWWRGSTDSESNWRFTAFLNGDGFFTTVQSGPLATGNSGNAWDLTPGEYHRIRVYTAVGTPGTANGVLKCWVDAELICDLTDLVMVDQADPTHVFNAGWLMGYSNAGYAAQTDFYIDDFKLWTSSPGW